MPLDNHQAFGNFISDVLHGRNIVIKGDGRSVRSYLYIADLSVWLWKILFKGEVFHPYNVGSENALNLKDLAKLMASFSTESDVKILGDKTTHVSCYVPSTGRARTELGLREYIGLKEGICKTLAYYRSGNNRGFK